MRRILCILMALGALAPVAAADSWVATPSVPGLEATYSPGGTLVAGRLGADPYLVLGRSRAGGGDYLRVAAPWRSGEAWVERASVTLSSTPLRVAVDRVGGVVRVFRGRDVILRAPATVGRWVTTLHGTIIARDRSTLTTTAFARPEQAPRVTLGTAPRRTAVVVSARDFARLRDAVHIGTPFVVR